jgi:hypothetical protein
MTGLADTLLEIDRLLEEDRAVEALELVEEMWQPDMLTGTDHNALAARGMVASYTIAEYREAAMWLERTRKHASADAQPYLALLGATFQRLHRLTAALTRGAPPPPAQQPPGGDAGP